MISAFCKAIFAGTQSSGSSARTRQWARDAWPPDSRRREAPEVVRAGGFGRGLSPPDNGVWGERVIIKFKVLNRAF